MKEISQTLRILQWTIHDALHTLPCEKLYRFPLILIHERVHEKKRERFKVDLHKFKGERVCEGRHVWSIVGFIIHSQ